MKQRIKRAELEELAAKAGLTVQHDCGGFRLVREASMIFPNTGVCPTATARECTIFLRGVLSVIQTIKVKKAKTWKRLDQTS